MLRPLNRGSDMSKRKAIMSGIPTPQRIKDDRKPQEPRFETNKIDEDVKDRQKGHAERAGPSLVQFVEIAASPEPDHDHHEHGHGEENRIAYPLRAPKSRRKKKSIV